MTSESVPPPPQAASNALLPPTVRSEAPSLSIWRRGGVVVSLSLCGEAFDSAGEKMRGVRAPRESSETDMVNREGNCGARSVKIRGDAGV